MRLFLYHLCYISLLIPSGICAQQTSFIRDIYQYIENPAIYGQNQEEGRTCHIPEKNIPLNGEWKFYYSDTPEKIPADFYQPGYNIRAWETITVPSNWEMMGYGDKLFRNVHAPFKANPPHVPREYNPTGAYRRQFDIPGPWTRGQIFLRLEKVASASFIWINGREVGYNEGAQEPAEYNITPYIRAGKNDIAVLVTKYSDGYYLEGQDYWRLAGIFDDVTIYATPQVRLFDWQVVTDLDETYTDATLHIKTDIKKYQPLSETKFTLKTTLHDNNGQTISHLESDPFTLTTPKQQVALTTLVKNPRKWTSETPDLYTLHIQLTDTAGNTIDQVRTRIGFKETEIRDGIFYLNGVPLKVNAQNSHMQHPELGHTMNEKTIRKDFEILKQFNFNAVRTSHYPPVNRYLELADEYGLYIIDEAGVEAHATEFISEKPEYTPMYKERVRQMVLRDRNHPSILFWSAGNESGEGSNITEVVKEGRKYDHTRYWMYGGNAFAHPAEDIIGPRYPTPMELEMQVGITPDSNELRPSFMDEYLSVAGNGGGGLDDYWRVIYAHPRIIGGAIWDFVSTGITERVRRIKDSSPHNTPVHLMGNARLVDGPEDNVADLNGHDQWIEVYRSRNVEINGNQLTLACEVYPRKLISSCGSLITKGSYQYGLQQRGKDSLEFYIHTTQTHRLKAAIPPDWENNWHQVTATYDGRTMAIHIDGKEKASMKASGNITNFPFPVNIGRNAEIHGQETDVYICDAQFNNVGIFPRALPPGKLDPREAALWLEFEEETDEGPFYSYGIGARTYGSIWPDRTVQPEMWQMKKTVQPISVTLVDAGQGLVEVWNRNHYLNTSHYKTHWSIVADGLIIQEGDIHLDVPPLSKKVITLPYIQPAITPGTEYYLTISSTLKQDEIWAHAGHEVAWDQFQLPWTLPPAPEPQYDGQPATLATTTDEIKVTGRNFRYTFDRRTGALASMQVHGREMLRSPLKMNIWRAPLANEQDEWSSYNINTSQWKTGYGRHIVTEFYSTGIDTLTHIPLSVETKEAAGKIYVDVREIWLTGSSTMEKKDLYIWGMQSNGFENQYTYIIDGEGQVTIKHTILPQGRMPAWLPRIGITLALDKNLRQVEWYGRGPYENYPDRKTGYKIDIYQTTVDDMYEPYLIPQDYGLRTDTRWVSLTGEEGTGIMFRADGQFNFNAYPYTTDNLTKAMYTYQLQEYDGITFNLDYATSGVGCTARSILNAYRALPQKYERTITIKPVGM